MYLFIMNIEEDIPEISSNETMGENEALIEYISSPRYLHIKKDLQDLSNKCLSYKKAHLNVNPRILCMTK